MGTNESAMQATAFKKHSFDMFNTVWLDDKLLHADDMVS